jgi:hypothetical protein
MNDFTKKKLRIKINDQKKKLVAKRGHFVLYYGVKMGYFSKIE